MSVAVIHARIWAQLHSQGATIGIQDSQIGATAIARDYTVLTENVREFSRIPGLKVQSLSW
jgi:tRNA(fMet)-specific endonuclease VapC